MLVLSRQRGESIVIGGIGSGFPEITIEVVGVHGKSVRLGVMAPQEVPVHRKEVHEAIQRESAWGEGGKKID